MLMMAWCHNVQARHGSEKWKNITQMKMMFTMKEYHIFWHWCINSICIKYSNHNVYSAAISLSVMHHVNSLIEAETKFISFCTPFSNVFPWIKIYWFWLKFVGVYFKGLIDNIPALVQIMAWHRSGDKPLSEPMTNILLRHICITRPQRVNTSGWPVGIWHNNIYVKTNSFHTWTTVSLVIGRWVEWKNSYTSNIVCESIHTNFTTWACHIVELIIKNNTGTMTMFSHDIWIFKFSLDS